MPCKQIGSNVKAVSRFEISLLIMLMAEFYPDIKSNSNLIGTSAGCNPVTVRSLYSKLKKAGLLDSKPGPYGLHLAKDPRDISLWDIMQAADGRDVERMFLVEVPLSGTCSLSENIHEVLFEKLQGAYDAMRRELEAVSLYDFAWQLPETYEEDPEDRLRIMHDALKELEKTLPADS